MKNFDIRMKIGNLRLRHFEVAEKIGISPCTLSVWLRFELPPDKKIQVLDAIEQLVRERESA